MLQIVFGILMGSGLLFGLLRGEGGAALGTLLGAAEEAVETALSLAGGFALFCGMMGILREAGLAESLARRLARPLRALLGRGTKEDALDYVTLNLASNMLGLGNAATPMGIEGAKRLAEGERASDALCMFLVINTSSVQLLPTTVIALRTAAGSAAPGAIILPALIATSISTAVGILSCKVMQRWT